MSVISILPDVLINKIAAGEVIERPASVVRELLDNAIDAGATRIVIDILHGGRKLIRVSDNGSGMDREDALLCFERHATSKINSEDELFHISTLGFRGEALPSIASISKVTLTTAAAGSDTGVTIEIGANQKREIRECPPEKGTTVEVRDIFYNTPARRKFLKTVPTELSHVIETVVQKAFAYYRISFTLSHNNNELLNAPAASGIKERLVQLYGEEMGSEFLEVRKESKAISLMGFISGHDVTRSSRSHQLIFVNSRPVKNTTINHAVYNAYRDEMQKDRHPAYFMFLEIDPERVDVNVHPAKREVKFERPDEVHTFVGAAISETLHPGTGIDLSPMHAVPGSGHRGGTGYQLSQQESAFVGEAVARPLHSEQTDFFQAGITPHVQAFFHIGESFIATVNENGLVIIDQHAAHERVLYERFLKKSFVETEPLFLPLRIELPVKEYNLIVRHRDVLMGFGIDMEEFGGNSIIIRALPRELGKADVKGLMLDIASGLLEEATSGVRGDFTEDTLLKNIAARLACHKSVRGREHLNNEELSTLMSDLDKADEPGKCPHGRPTRIYFSLDDLNRMFKRK